MRDLVAKYPDGYEGWADARQERVAAEPTDVRAADVAS